MRQTNALPGYSGMITLLNVYAFHTSLFFHENNLENFTTIR